MLSLILLVIVVNLDCYVIGAGVSEPHTRVFNSGISLIYVHICIVRRTSGACIYAPHADDMCVI